MGASRELGKLYLVVQKSNQWVRRMGISPGSVAVEDSETEALVIIDGEKPTHLSEFYFKLVDEKLVDMLASEKIQVDVRIKTEIDVRQVNEMKRIIALNPAGVREALDL